MSDHVLTGTSALEKYRLYRTTIFMGLSTVLVSAAFISYCNSIVSNVVTESVYDSFQLAVLTLMPYMISAVIAAITAVGMMTILPATRVADPARELEAQLREVAAGDLTVRVTLHAGDPLRGVGNAFNGTVATLSDQIAAWKVINRQQWGVLCRIRQAVEEGNCTEAVRFMDEMEQNWDRIAEIEQRLIT